MVWLNPLPPPKYPRGELTRFHRATLYSYLDTFDASVVDNSTTYRFLRSPWRAITESGQVRHEHEISYRFSWNSPRYLRAAWLQWRVQKIRVNLAAYLNALLLALTYCLITCLCIESRYSNTLNEACVLARGPCWDGPMRVTRSSRRRPCC